MKFKIFFTRKGMTDSFEVLGDSVAECTSEKDRFFQARGIDENKLENCWSEPQ